MSVARLLPFSNHYAGLMTLLAACLLFAHETPAGADSWMLPSAREYVSENGRFRLTVLPRELRDQLSYFVDLERKKERAGQKRGGRTEPLGILAERNADGSWSTRWRAPLVNDVAPTEAVVSDDGKYVITFDNWHAVGYGGDTVAIYGPDGEALRTLALSDFLSQDYIAALPHTTSSIHWRDKPRVSGQDLVIPVAHPAKSIGGLRQYVTFTATLPGGVLAPADAADWQTALQKVHAQ